MPNVSSKSPFNCEKISNDINEDITEKKYEIVFDETVSKVSLDGEIDILAINALCTKYLIQEENNYLNTIKLKFETAWHQIDLGENIMEDYIRFCMTRKQISYDFFERLNRQFR